MFALSKVNPATPPDKSAGVAAVEVQNGIRPEVSADEVATGLDAAAEPVIVKGDAPIVVKGEQDTVPEHDTVVVGYAVRRNGPAPVTIQPEGKVVVPVPPCGIVACANAKIGRANKNTSDAMSFFIYQILSPQSQQGRR